MKLRCAECGTPVAALQNGCLVIESKHHGEKHVSAFSVWELLLLVLKQITGEIKEREKTAEL